MNNGQIILDNFKICCICIVLQNNLAGHLGGTKEINLRQYAILTQVMDRGKPLPIDELRRAP